MADDRDAFTAEVGAKLKRKLSARRASAHGVWSGLSMMGLVGWSVVVPTLLGAFAGHWLDGRVAGPQIWTLALLVTGLLLGCANAAYWVAREGLAAHAPAESDDA